MRLFRVQPQASPSLFVVSRFGCVSSSYLTLLFSRLYRAVSRIGPYTLWGWFLHVTDGRPFHMSSAWGRAEPPEARAGAAAVAIVALSRHCALCRFVFKRCPHKTPAALRLRSIFVTLKRDIIRMTFTANRLTSKALNRLDLRPAIEERGAATPSRSHSSA